MCENLESLVEEEGHLAVSTLGCIQEEGPSTGAVATMRVEKDLDTNLGGGRRRQHQAVAREQQQE